MSTEFAASLRAFRKRLHLTQEEMAAKIDVSRGRYSNWETGAAKPKIEQLRTLKDMGFGHASELNSPASTAADRSDIRELLDDMSVFIEVVCDEGASAQTRQKAKDRLQSILASIRTNNLQE